MPYNTRADFYISLSGVEKEGLPVDDPKLLTAAKDIAVYLDGYTYHATAENFRFADDLKCAAPLPKAGASGAGP